MANASSQTHPPRVFITHQSNVASQTSPIVVNKLNTEVNLKPNDAPNRQPITTIVTSAPTLDSSKSCAIATEVADPQPSPRTPMGSLLQTTSSSSGAMPSTSVTTIVAQSAEPQVRQHPPHPPHPFHS
jgi:hypothetical protein